ncbi:MAG: HAD family hydrolase [Bacteroidota bacterium]|nr:HAD family hydrolase [Bacteroidota bacterium]
MWKKKHQHGLKITLRLKMQKIKAVIFDLDGTLANTLPLCIQAFRQSIEPLIKRSLSDAEIIATFGPSEEGTIIALAPKHYNKGVADYLRLYENLHEMCPVPFDGIKELLETLKSKGVHISMVTGKGKHSTNISLKHFDLSHFFEFIETGSPDGARKAEGFKIILNSLKDIKSNEVIYVGDATSDIIASRKVGVPVVAAAWAATTEPEKLKELKPDELFYNIKDFSNWLFDKI